MFRRMLGLYKSPRYSISRHSPVPRVRPASSTKRSPNAKEPVSRISPLRARLNRLTGLFRTPLAIVLSLFIGGHILFEYFVTYVPCAGISMLPTFNSYGDWILISKWYRRGRGIQIGDIVSYAHPIEEGEFAVKRVLGLPGDFVERDTPGVGTGQMIQVPKGHCWIVGDNLKYSRDSRMFGPLPLALVKGKVVYRLTSPWYFFAPQRLERFVPSADVD